MINDDDLMQTTKEQDLSTLKNTVTDLVREVNKLTLQVQKLTRKIYPQQPENNYQNVPVFDAALSKKNQDLFDEFLTAGNRNWYSRKYKEALLCFDQAILINPNYWLAYKLRSDVYLQLDKKKEAIADLQMSLKSHFDNPFKRLIEDQLQLLIPQVSPKPKKYLSRSQSDDVPRGKGSPALFHSAKTPSPSTFDPNKDNSKNNNSGSNTPGSLS